MRYILLGALVCALVASGCTTDDFSGPNGYISTHDGYWAGQQEDDLWATESGVFWRLNNTGYVNDDIFRTWTYGESFAQEQVVFQLKTIRFLAGTPEHPTRDFDGVKIWLRTRHEDGGVLGAAMSGSPAGYTAEVNHRDGTIYVQKKVPGTPAQWPDADSCIQGGCYWVIGPNAPNKPASLGQWETVGGQAVTNSNGTVTISVIRNGSVVLSVVDNGTEGGPPLTQPGRIGIRGDNTEFYVDNFAAG